MSSWVDLRALHSETASEAAKGAKDGLPTWELRISHLERCHAIAQVFDAGFNPLKDECQLIVAQLVFHWLSIFAGLVDENVKRSLPFP
jgi:hypothetical protein